MTPSDESPRLHRLAHDVVQRALAAWPDAAYGIAYGMTTRGLPTGARDDAVRDAPVRDGLRTACEAARADGFRVDQLLVALKTAWSQVPEARRWTRNDGHDLLAHVVTLCIREYYQPRSAPIERPGVAAASRIPSVRLRARTRPARGTSARDPDPRVREAPGPVRVLVVDDTATVRATLVRLLTRAGHDVVGEAATVADALASAVALTPDVVLLDVHLPDGLGTAAAAQLTAARSTDAGRVTTGLAPAVVLCTGDVDGISVADRAHAGAFAVLPKPVSLAVLDAAVRGAADARARAPSMSEEPRAPFGPPQRADRGMASSPELAHRPHP